MQHSLALVILHVREASGDLVGNVDPSDRLPDDRVVLRVLERRLGVDNEAEVLAADERRVGDAFAAGLRHDDAVLDDDGVLVDAELRGALGNQRLAAGGRCLADLHPAVLDGQAAERDALVGRQRRVALDDGDAIERHRELLGGDLRHRRADSRAEVDLPRVNGHVALRVDREKAVDLIGGDRLRTRCLADRRRRFRRRSKTSRRARHRS